MKWNGFANRVIVAVSALSLAALSPTWATEPSRPNILLILVDDLGYGDLGGFGAKDLRTPNIDALAARGMTFRNFYASCPVCSPSRAAILSGMDPDRVGVPGVIRTDPEDSWGYLSDRVVLLPALLKAAGYHTALVGKWHLGLGPRDAPNARGFESFRGFLGDMMDDYGTHLRQGRNYMRRDGRTIEPEGRATDLFTQWAVEYLRDRAPAAKSGKAPFFLMLAYNAPHAPIQPPTAWLDRVRGRAPGLDEKRAKLVALIEHLDDGIGQVLDALKQTGLDGDTLVVFTSDNGGDVPQGARNGPWRGSKGQMYEGGIRVPAAVAWPGHVALGASTDRVAIHVDLLPTLCDAAGVAPPAGIDGRSLLPTLEGRAADPVDARELYWVRREGGPFAGLASHALRRGDWKLVHNTPFSPLELYNLKDDPLERRDLAASHPRVRDDLARALKLHVLRSGPVPWRGAE